MTLSPNFVELKQCLQEAGMYEENMNEDEMRNYYNAIKSSESTAKEEYEQRNTDGNQSDLTSDNDDIEQIDTNMSTDDKPDSKKENLDGNEDDESILDPLDCSPIKHRLTIIYHPPRYNLPPHIDPKLSKLSLEEKAKIISAFHSDILQKFYELHKKSKIMAALGNPIHSSENFKEWLSIEQDNELPEETYILRSGRQIKRKVYIEDVDSDSDKKRSKKDDDDNDENEYKPVIKRHNPTKPSNQEIMKRSKFFTESPKSSRSEAMFQQLAANEKKRHQEEEKIEHFKHSLYHVEDDDDVIPMSQPQPTMNDDDDFEDVTEIPVTRRRIPPPLHGRRGIGAKRATGVVALSEIDKLKPSESSPKQPLQRSLKADVKSPRTSTSVGNKEKTAKGLTKCPICSEFFHRDEVEAHASNCGLGMETPVTFEPAPDKSLNNLQCGICDKQMMMNTDYEIHVAECMRKERMK